MMDLPRPNGALRFKALAIGACAVTLLLAGISPSKSGKEGTEENVPRSTAQRDSLAEGAAARSEILDSAETSLALDRLGRPPIAFVQNLGQ